MYLCSFYIIILGTRILFEEALSIKNANRIIGIHILNTNVNNILYM